MNPMRLSSLAVPLALAACGGSGTATPFQDAAPSSAALAINVDTASTATATASATNASPSTPTAGTLPATCHPLLFARTEAVARRLNRHFAQALGPIEHVIARNPTLATDGKVVWTETRNGLDVRFTMTRTGEVYTWTLELRPAGAADGAWATVFSGDVDRTGATAPHDGKGAFTLDLDALHSVVTALDVAGKLQATFDLSAKKRLVAITAGGVKWDPDTDGDLARVAATNASYTYLREPGVGGSLVLDDAMIFLCPANPALAPANAELVSRWYVTSSGEIHGRSDAEATGGQIPAGDRWMGVTCHTRAADPASIPDELYWMVKDEDAQGTTVASWQTQMGSGACDAAFGSVPSATADTSDFDFAGVTAPYPFPGVF